MLLPPHYRLTGLICLLLAASFLCSCNKSSGSSSGSSGSSGSTGSSGTSLKISSISPSNGPDSTTVTIVGTGFSATSTADNVSFNGKQATVLSASTTQLTAMVPTLAGSGTVAVTVNGTTRNGPSFTYDTTWRVTLLQGGMGNPRWLALDSLDNIYVTVPVGYGKILKITPQGDTSTFATPLLSPEGVTIDGSGNIYAEGIPSGYPTFSKFNSAGIPTVIGTDTGTIAGLAIDANGNLFVSNIVTQTIDEIDAQGRVSVFVPNIPFPSGLAFDKSGNLYVTSTNNTLSATAGVIFKISPTGSRTTAASGLMLSGYNGIAVDQNDNLYVTCLSSELSKSLVVKISPGGAISTVSKTFNAPLGIAVDADNNLYVVDMDVLGGPFGTVSKLTMH